MAQRNPQQAGLPNSNGVPQQQRLPVANSSLPPNPTPNPNNQNLTVPGQNRPRPMPPQNPGTAIQSSLRPPQLPMNGAPSVPMHGIQGQLPHPNLPLDVGLVARAQNISEQQRQAIRLQQQGQLSGQSPQMHNSPPRMNGLPQPGFPMPNHMMQSFIPNANGVGTPPGNNMVGSPVPNQGQSGSPRMGQAMHGSTISTIKAYEQQLQSKFPTLPPEQITRLVQENLSKQVQQQQRQNLTAAAMNAAAGGNSMTGSVQGTPQLYAQMMRQQQETQQKAVQAQQQASVSNSKGPNPSGSGQSHGN